LRRNLALFDYEGTLSTRDTFIAFIIFQKGMARFLAGMLLLSPSLILYRLKLIPNYEAKQRVMRFFFGGQTQEEFNELCNHFAQQKISGLLRHAGMNALRQHQEKGDKVIVVSASAENWVKPWCAQNGIDCIATRLEVKDGKMTGNIDGQNCYGPEKAKRVREALNLSEYGEISAYGDSRGDRELLALAQHKYYRKF
jgi:HAD superfamily hydrolase (TIGR01490 family)